MNGKLLVLTLGAIALIAVLAFTVFDAGSLFESGDADDVDGGGGDALSIDDGTGSGTTGGEPDRGPALFGRGTQAAGPGDALGRVLAFDSKQPVVGATLTLTGTGRADEVISVKATTGPDGRFHLSKVPAGEGLVLAISSPEAGSRVVRHLTVSAGRVEDFGTIWLGQSGVLEGRVIDSLERGVANADVQVHPGAISMQEMMSDFADLLGRLDSDPEPVARGRTDSSGRFRIAGVPPGPATIIVRGDGYQLAIRPITMTKDGVVGGDLIIKLDEATPLSGRVVNQDGQGVADARVAFMDQGNTETGFFARQFVRTDERGSFVVQSPPDAARLVAVIAAEGYPTLFKNFTADEREGIVFVLVGGASLTIRILDDETGAPIAGANVLAMLTEKAGMGGMSKGGSMLPALTDERGEAEVLARPGYVPMVIVTHPTHGRAMYMPQFMSNQALGGAVLKGPDSVKLKPGRNELVLRKPAGLQIVGTLMGPDGPVAGAKIALSGQMAFLGGGKAVTDENGEYEMVAPKLPAMFMRLSVTAPGYVQSPDSGAVTIGEERPIRADLTVEHAAQIEGVVKGPDGMPLAGVEVRLRNKSENANPMAGMFTGDSTVMTDGKGRYRFDTVTRDSRYYVVGRRDGFIDTGTEPFQVGASADVVEAPELTLSRGVDLKIHVVDPGGRDVEGARVDVHVERADKAEWDELSAWRSFAKVVTDADGIATVRAVPDGKVTLTARADGFAGARKTTQVTLASPPADAVEVALREGMKIAGKVIDRNGRAVEGASLQLHAAPQAMGGHGDEDTDAQWTDSMSAETGPGGRFRFTNASMSGSVRISVYMTGYVTKTVTVRGRFEDFEIVIQKVDPSTKRRREELTEEITTLVAEMQAAKDDEERQRVVERLQQVQQELGALGTEEAGAEEVIEPDDG